MALTTVHINKCHANADAHLTYHSPRSHHDGVSRDPRRSVLKDCVYPCGNPKGESSKQTSVKAVWCVRLGLHAVCTSWNYLWVWWGFGPLSPIEALTVSHVSSTRNTYGTLHMVCVWVGPTLQHRIVRFLSTNRLGLGLPF